MDEEIQDEGDIVNNSASTRAPKVRMNALRYFRRNSELGCVMNFVIIGLISSAILLSVGWPITGGIALVLTILLLMTIFWCISLRKIEFQNALLVPGVVISSAPLRIAVLAEMSTGGGRSVLAVKTIDCKETSPFSKTVGTRVPCVAAFQGDGRNGVWDQVVASSLADGCGDIKILQRCLNRVDEEEWKTLEAFISRTTFPVGERLLFLNQTPSGPPPLPGR
ncbi:MAG: DUF3239 domain-containing protein [Verrucomicrobiaceae bacterium]|nr:MAG: DUF3239 domain-containing protein [Verrucomicrobiaceae bacterium]